MRHHRTTAAQAPRSSPATLPYDRRCLGCGVPGTVPVGVIRRPRGGDRPILACVWCAPRWDRARD